MEDLDMLGAETIGYAPSEVLPPGAAPRGSSLPAPAADKRYVRDPDNRGWVVVPAAWITAGFRSWTTAKNPQTGQMVNQLLPPAGGLRGTYYNQPVYSDAEAYGGTLSTVSRDPMPAPPSAAPPPRPAPLPPAAWVPAPAQQWAPVPQAQPQAASWTSAPSAPPPQSPSNYFGPSGRAGVAAASAVAARGCDAMGDSSSWLWFVLCMMALLMLVWVVRRATESVRS